MTQRYTIAALTENTPGVLHRLASILTQRRINIESMTVSETETKGISRFTVVVTCAEDGIEKIVKRIERIVEVIEVFAAADEELLYSEIAFLKIIPANPEQVARVEQIAENHLAHIVTREHGAIVLEKTGREDDITRFLQDFNTFEVDMFVRSGRIAIRYDK